MAQIITLQILVRDNDEERIKQGITDMLTVAQTPVDPDDQESQPWLASWSIKDIEPANEAVEEVLAGGGHEVDSILEKDFVVCFAGQPDNLAFRSKELGPVSLDLATKYGPTSIRIVNGVMEQEWQTWKQSTRAYISIAPYGLKRFVAKVMDAAEPGREAEAALKAFELWAETGEDAREKVLRIHPAERLISVRPA